jgi:hypothetical protein
VVLAADLRSLTASSSSLSLSELFTQQEANARPRTENTRPASTGSWRQRKESETERRQGHRMDTGGATRR